MVEYNLVLLGHCMNPLIPKTRKLVELVRVQVKNVTWIDICGARASAVSFFLLESFCFEIVLEFG